MLITKEYMMNAKGIKYNIDYILSTKGLYRENPFIEPITVKKSSKNRWSKYEIPFFEPIVRLFFLMIFWI